MKIMKLFIYFTLGLHLTPSFAISSYTAISQNGGFSVSYFSPLIFDKNESEKHSNLIAYRSILTNSQIMIGPIVGDTKLDDICKNPEFLKTENISDVNVIQNNDIFYFDIEQYKACIIDFSENKAALVIEIPKFLVKNEKIKNIAIIAVRNDIRKLIFNISFSLSAEEIFVNILQIAEAYSPLKNQNYWNEIYNQGIEFIDIDTNPCKAWIAAEKFLGQELNNPDLPSRFMSVGVRCNPNVKK